MRLRGKIWNIDNPVDGIYELVIARKANNQLLYAVFTMFGDKWEQDLSSLAIDEMIEVDYFVKARSYTDKAGKERWSNSLIVKKLIYEKEPKAYQSNMHSQFNRFEKE